MTAQSFGGDQPMLLLQEAILIGILAAILSLGEIFL